MKVRHRYHQTRICNSWVAIIEQYVQIKLVTTTRHGFKFPYFTGDARNGINPFTPTWQANSFSASVGWKSSMPFGTSASIKME